MKKTHLLLLSLLSGLLLFLSWPPAGFPFLSFVAFIPLFLLSDQLLIQNPQRRSWGKALLYSYPAFIIWNAATTWWIWNSTPEGSIATFLLNSLFMAIVFGLWHRFRSFKFSPATDALALIAVWCSWEYLHLNWDITWPWLNLGNVFSHYTACVQWYEITGAFGGTIWVLLSNILLYHLYKQLFTKSQKRTALAIASALCLFLPIGASLLRYFTYMPEASENERIEAVVVQQNMDVWDDEYRLTNDEHIQRILRVAQPLLSDSTRLLICSESAIPHSISSQALIAHDYPAFNTSYSGFLHLDTLLQRYPNLNIIAGMSTVEFFDKKATLTCRPLGNGTFIDFHNSSACYNRDGLTALYYKSKLVPGVEKMPYPKIFGFLEQMAIDLGGTSGSLGIDTLQRAFLLQGTDVQIGVPICYESAYGEHFSKFINNGASLLAVITNDAWWGDTPGYKQHFLFSKLRAVETRHPILRAANTGISAYIDERGDAHEVTSYETQTAFKVYVTPRTKQTLYTRYGDYLARLAVAITLALFIWSLLYALSVRKKTRCTAQNQDGTKEK